MATNPTNPSSIPETPVERITPSSPGNPTPPEGSDPSPEQVTPFPQRLSSLRRSFRDQAQGLNRSIRTNASSPAVPTQRGEVPAEVEGSSTVASLDGPQSVIVPKDFVLPPTGPVEVVQVSITIDEHHHRSFLVIADIADDPKLMEYLITQASNSLDFGAVESSFDNIRLNDFSSIGIYTVAEMEEQIKKLEDLTYLLQDYIPPQSVNIMVGDSGIGKSPFCYELAICIAAGVPFLGISTTQARVLYLDYEDDVSLMVTYANAITRKLRLPKTPDTFQFWSPAMAGQKREPFDLIKQFQPDMVFIDTLSTAFPQAETENQIATNLYNRCRDLGIAVMFIHHMKKDSSSTDTSTFDHDLDRETTVKDFLDVRGAGQLVNSAFLRLKLIRARANDEDWAFIVRGYRRGKGGLPTLSIGRMLDEDGTPLGHVRLGGLSKLNADYRKVFENLPERFRFKDLNSHLKGGGSKQAFLRACEAVKLLSPKKDGDYYQKLPGWND